MNSKCNTTSKRPVIIKVEPSADDLDVRDFCIKVLGLHNEKQEKFHVIELGSSLNVFGYSMVAKGSENGCCVDPIDIFMQVILSGCRHFVIAHNQPNAVGFPVPSVSDIKLTKEIRKAAKIFKLDFYDHIIVGSSGDIYSFAGDGKFKAKK